MHAHTQVSERGEKGMGFSQTATTHHFFSRCWPPPEIDPPVALIPMFVHETVPPGVQEMKQLKKQIRYSFEETPNGHNINGQGRAQCDSPFLAFPD